MRWIYLKSSFLFWFGCIWATVGLALLGAGLTQLLSQGDVTVIEAQVVEKGRDADREGLGRYWLRTSWTDADGTHAGLVEVDEPTWRLNEEGDTVSVERRADGPAHVRSSQEGSLAGALFTGIGLLFGGVGLALALFGYRRAGRRVRVIAEGLVAQAVVESVDRNLHVRINGRNPEFFTYRYRDEIGRDRAGRSPDLPRRLEGRWHPGDRVRVLYDALEPDVSEADIFELRAG